MKPLLVITAPRRIPEVVDSWRDSPIDTVLVSGMNLNDACRAFNRLVADSDYTHYVVCADDCVITPDAVLAVCDALGDGNRAVTGWCRLDRTHECANVTSVPLLGDAPVEGAYSFYRATEVEEHPYPLLYTGFMGMALSGMSREDWLRYPMGCYGDPGWSSDFYLSRQLRDDRVPMWCARDGYVDHVKEVWQKLDRDPEKRIMIGEVTRGLVWL